MSTAAASPSPDELLQHARYLRNLARRLVRDESEAEDLVQDTWTEVLLHPAAGVSRLRPWLAGVLRNLARERARGEGRRKVREVAVARSEAAPADAGWLERIESFRSLAREVIELEEPYRSTIVQTYFEGLSARAIAERAGVPAATVRSRHMRALQQLRERLDRRYEGRSAWLAVFLPCLREWAEPTTQVTRWWLAAGALLALLGGAWLWRTLPAGSANAPELASLPAAGPISRGASGGAGAEEPRVETGRAPAAITTPGLAAPRAALELSLRDLHTGEPVPFFAIDVRAPDGSSARAVSDAAGELRSERAYPAGRLDLYLLDDPALAAWRERPRGSRVVPWLVPWSHQVEGGRRVLELDVGPTYRIDLGDESLPEIEDGLALLVAPPEPGLASETRAPLRSAGGGCWVRFSNEARTLPERALWCLELRQPERLARAAVSAHAGVAPGLLRLEWFPAGALALRAHDASGPLAARYEIEDLVTPGVVLESGELGLDPGPLRLPLGHYHARVLAAGHAPASRDLQLADATPVRLDLALERLPGLGAVSGSLRLPPGVRPPEARVYLCPRAQRTGEEPPMIVARPRAGEPALYDFRFEDVSAGEYVLCARANGIYRWQPGELAVRAPASELVLEALGTSQPQRLIVRAFEAGTGAPVTQFEGELEVDPDALQGPVRDPRSTSTGTLHFGWVPADARLRWSVVAEGYRAVQGDERPIVREQDHLALRVELVRGWAREILALDARGTPIAGAQVLLDGQPAGLTDARGILWVEADAPPLVLALHSADGKRLVQMELTRLGSAAQGRVRARVTLPD